MPLRLCARTSSVLSTLVALLSFAELAFAAKQETPPRQSPATAAASRSLTVFLDCESCFQDYLRAEVGFVDFVRDRTEADVHVLITRAETGPAETSTLQFIGARAFGGVTNTLRTVTTASDSEDGIRRQLATALRVGILGYLSRETLPAGLAVTVRTNAGADRPGGAADRWNKWVFSLRGSASFEGEESSRERELGGNFSRQHQAVDLRGTRDRVQCFSLLGLHSPPASRPLRGRI